MILKRLVLENYKQHSLIDQSFSGNVIGIIGDNGSGKSNLLGGMHFVLAGEQPGFNRGDLLKWGTTSGHAELYFEHNGEEGHIYRSLNSSEATFKLGKGKTISGIAKVAKAIEEELGMDKDLLKQTVFVRQAELDNVLFTDPRIRELSFQKLCGIGDAAKINKQLGEIMSTLGTPPNYDEQIAEGTVRYEELKHKVSELNATLGQMNATRCGLPGVQHLQTQIVSLSNARAACGRLEALSVEVQRYAKRIGDAQDELNALPTQDLDLTTIDKDIEQAKTTIGAIEAYERAFQTWEGFGKQLVALGDAPVKTDAPVPKSKVDELQKMSAELTAIYSDVAGNLKLYKGVMAACSAVVKAGTKCPLCGNTIENVDYLKNQIAALSIQAAASDPTKVRAEFGDAIQRNQSHDLYYQADSNRYKSQFEVLMARYVDAQKNVDALKAYAPKAGDYEISKATLARLTQERQSFLSSSTRRTTLATSMNNDKGYLVEAGAKIGIERKTLEGYKIDTPEQINEARTALDAKMASMQNAIAEIRAIDGQIAQFTGMTEATMSSLNDLEKTLADLNDRRSKQGAYKAAVDVIGAVRDWFHYANGPHTLANSVLTSMTADVNDFLEKFSARFVVMPGDEALGFKYMMTDGSAMPSDGYPDAMHLSGGQKVQLAIAFRFAAYTMFANKVGLLTLDEPTVFLDEKNIGYFCVLMDKVREVAREMKLQVILSTHEKSVLPYLDSLIDLSKS